MDAVRDRADRRLLDRAVGPEAVPQLARDLPVQGGHAVRVRCRAQRERCEPEALLALVHAAESSEVLPREAAARDDGADVPLDERCVEDLVSGRYRRMGREHRRRAQALHRLVPGDVPVLDELAQALELEERGVALVHVEDGGLDSECAENTHASDAKHELLPQPVQAVATVELVGDRPCPVRVAVDVRVEQIERHAPHVHAPDS